MPRARSHLNHMRGTMSVLLIAAAAHGLPAFGQVTEDDPVMPRLDGVEAAEATEIAISELNTRDYPDVTILATVTLDGIPVPGLGAGDFRVREDEVDQEPLTVAAQLPP